MHQESKHSKNGISNKNIGHWVHELFLEAKTKKQISVEWILILASLASLPCNKIQIFNVLAISNSDLLSVLFSFKFAFPIRGATLKFYYLIRI